jgi:hypothetical protein
MPRSRTLAIAATAVALAAGCLVGTGVAIASGPDSNDSATPQGMPVSPAAVTPPAVMETVFVPITPCRIIDTRAAGGQIAANATRAFRIRGTTGFEAQGGTSGGCGIPQSATGIMVSVSSVNIGGTGYFRAWPYGQSAPNASIAHYEAGPITTTGATMTLGDAGGAYDLNIRAYSAPASIVVDVTGYFAPQMAAFVGLDGSLQFATPRVLAASHVSTGNYLVTFDTDVSECSFVVTPYAYNWAVAVGPQLGNVNQAHIYIHDQGSSTTPHDTSFYIQAVC